MANVASGAAKVVQSTFDPEVEFLEIGVKVDSAKSWKIYGPDSTGDFGDLQGIGGLEAIIRETGTVKVGIANDYFGNVVGTVPTAGGSFVWSQTQLGGYGPIPGSTVKTFKDSANLEDVLAWKGRRVDETGFINMGARHYEPNGGRFLSPDPAGHGSDMSLYAYADGDPVNQVDADGRLATQYHAQAVDALNGGLLSAAAKNPERGLEWRDFVKTVGEIKLPTQGQVVSGLLNSMPVVSFYKGMYEHGTGLDMVTGERVSENEAIFTMVTGSILVPEARGLTPLASAAERFAPVNISSVGNRAASVANKTLNSGGDSLLRSLGPAHLNNAAELASITTSLKNHGVEIDYRAGQYAYGPRAGGAGNLVIDPDASISAWLHEYGHFLDDLANGQPGLRAYMENPYLRLATERRQYLREIRTARQIGDEAARRQLTIDYLAEKSATLGK